tara:strand:+ start:92 stop:475 length:384 start_codon:yes stop_codon:yes gene_type:complete
MRPVSNIVRQAQEQLGVFPFRGYGYRFQKYDHKYVVYSLHYKDEVYVGLSRCIGSRINKHVQAFNGNQPSNNNYLVYKKFKAAGCTDFAQEVDLKIHFVPKGYGADDYERKMINEMSTCNTRLMEAA